MSYSNGPKIVTNGLVLYLDAGNTKSYPGSGTSWFDLSGNNNHGTLFNGPIFNTSNKGKIAFDGSNDYISVVENFGMAPQILTAEVIFRPNSTTNTGYGGNPASSQYLVARQNSRSSYFEGYVMTYNENGSVSIVSTPSTGITQYVTSSSIGSIAIGNIYVFVGIWNTVTQQIYINGSFVNSGTKASNIDYGNNHTLKIGRFIPAGGATWDSAFNGDVYGLKLYNRVLSDNEILQNYNAIKGRYRL